MDQQSFYQTGYTQPPRSYRGLIALLLITIVLLGSIATILGLLNIRLFRKLSEQAEDTSSLYFAQTASDSRGLSADANALGLSVKTLSVFDQKFYHLPQGVYITGVIPGSSAAREGILPGDILLSIQNKTITDAQDLESYLSTCHQGQQVNAVIFRDGKQCSVIFAVGG